MRIIAGKLGGRHLVAPSSRRTHPMSDKIRGALFNTLDDITGLTVLDAFAGSGALSFEAFSRGARHVTAIDVDRSAINTIVKSAKAFKLLDFLKAIHANVSSWSDKNPDLTFDIVLCDPPYDDLQLTLLQKLSKHLNDGGVLVLSWPGKLTAPELMTMKIIGQKTYGDAQLVFYKRIS